VAALTFALIDMPIADWHPFRRRPPNSRTRRAPAELPCPPPGRLALGRDRGLGKIPPP